VIQNPAERILRFLRRQFPAKSKSVFLRQLWDTAIRCDRAHRFHRQERFLERRRDWPKSDGTDSVNLHFVDVRRC
jgi:hypothetical protein